MHNIKEILNKSSSKLTLTPITSKPKHTELLKNYQTVPKAKMT